MAPVQPPWVLQNLQTHTAQAFRMALASAGSGPFAQGLTAPAGGVHPSFGNRLAVTGTAGMTVNVDTGQVNMGGSTAWQGMYSGYNTASYSVTVPASNSSQWRSDYIVARQQDVAFGDATNLWDIVDVAGAFSGSAPGSLPALPNNAVVLAIIRVVPNMTATNGGGTVVDARQYLPLPGVLYTTSASKPSLSCPEGTQWFETDTNQLGIIINGAYQYIAILLTGTIDPWHAMSPLHGWSAFGTGWTSPQYRLLPNNPDEVEIIGTMAVGTTANGTTIASTLPAAYQNTNLQAIEAMCIQGVTTSPTDTPYVLMTAGSLSVWGLPPGTATIFFHGTYSVSA
jgi:hypothetical protein